MSLLSGLLGAAGGFMTGGPVGAIVGGLGGLQSGQDQSQANAATQAQGDIARKQAGMYGAVSPYYMALLQQLAQHAGMGGALAGEGPSIHGWNGIGPTTEAQRWAYVQDHPELKAQWGQAGNLEAVEGAMKTDLDKMPQTSTTGVVPSGPSIYGGSIRNDQLGPYANPQDYLRQKAAEDQITRQTQNTLGNYNFGVGQRGLTNSSISAAGRAAILSDANNQRAAYGRNLAIQAPQEYERRLNMLGQSLNPGMAAGPNAAGIYGQQAATYANQAAGINQGVGNTISNLQYLKALKGYNQGGINTDITSPSGNQGVIPYSGMGNANDLGGNYSVYTPF